MKKKETINWGILATGSISARMANALLEVKNANLIAVASRSKIKAKEFAQKWNIPRFYESYEDLANDADIDLIYIGTPNICHYENILLCLNKGKNVLCEKPFTINRSQAAEVIEIAKSKNLFLMEAHKSNFLPGMKKIKELINNDFIGNIQSIKADFCVEHLYNPENRFFNLSLGGGALLDVGVYPILFVLQLLGYPTEINSNTIIGKTGVDIFSEITLKHLGNSASTIRCGIDAALPREAVITGESGYIKVHEPFHQAPKLTLKSGNNDEVEIDTSFTCNDLFFEAEQVTSCIKNGETECQEFPLSKTLEILKVIDEIRQTCGLQYSNELI